MRTDEAVLDDVVLGVLVLSGGAISPAEFAKNFNVDESRLHDEFERLERRGLAECISEDYFEPTSRGEDRVLTRGGGAAARSVS